MSAAQPSRFRATEAFGLFGLGVVFRGVMEQGCIRPGDCVSVVGAQATHHARVRSIERDRKLIVESVPDVELGLLLEDFDDPIVARWIAPGAWADEEALPPGPEVMLGLTFPLRIESASGSR